jgi:hypothetical protein
MGGVPIIGDLLAPPIPKAPKLPPAPPPPPTPVDPAVISARQRQRRQAGLSGGSVLTTPQGLTTQATTTKKTTLGS